MLEAVLEGYGIREAALEIFGNGLIHSTWKITTPHKQYILQKIQGEVFKKPQDIAYNIRLMGDYLQTKHADYLFVRPVNTLKGEELVFKDGAGYFRLFPFVPGSHSLNVVETPDQAYEAASQFGKFTRLLSSFPATQLRTTIPHFHDLEFRYQQFLQSLNTGNPERINHSKRSVQQVIANQNLVDEYRAFTANPACRLRVTHHDTKISNVLFDENNKAICIIDLDTVMPGYFISDVGDMMRTYLSPAGEEEKDFDNIEIRRDFYRAVVQGYAFEMKGELSSEELKHFFYAGRFMIFMQAIRFLTDYLNDDAYYGARYEGHNLVRAENQLVLLQRLTELKAELLRAD